MKILAKKFDYRSDLENEVRNKIGLTPDLKPEHTIEGTREELLKLNLSDRAVFWGIKCVITDEPTAPKKAPKEIDRGKKTDFGINNRDRKNPDNK